MAWLSCPLCVPAGVEMWSEIIVKDSVANVVLIHVYSGEIESGRL